VRIAAGTESDARKPAKNYPVRIKEQAKITIKKRFYMASEASVEVLPLNE